jgi:hypothetical protein
MTSSGRDLARFRAVYTRVKKEIEWRYRRSVNVLDVLDPNTGDFSGERIDMDDGLDSKIALSRQEDEVSFARIIKEEDMKLSPLFCASFGALAALALTADSAFATSPAMATDEAKACNKQGGFWVLVWRVDQPTIPVMCTMHAGGAPETQQCGHCYYPSAFDCFLAAGTWHPASANQPNEPLGYCILPDHSMQVNYPGSPGGGGTGGPGGGNGGGGVDCSKYGLISNGMGGCCLPGEGPCLLSVPESASTESMKSHKAYVDFHYIIEHEKACAKQSLVWTGKVCESPRPHRPMPEPHRPPPAQ